MGTFFSLSKSATSFDLEISEIALLLFGVLLVVGLIGEYAESDRWKKYVKVFEMFVIIGVAGELLADGGIFLFSSHLQTIADEEIVELTKEAGDAKSSAKSAETAAGGAKDESDKAKLAASNALTIAGNARSEADSFEHDIVSAKRQATAAEMHLAEASLRAANAERETESLKQRMADRDIKPEQREKMLQFLKGLKPEKVVVQSLLSEGREALQYAGKIADVFTAAGWNVTPPTGMGSSSIPMIGVQLVGGNDDEAQRLGDIAAGALIAGELSTEPVRFGTGPNKPKGDVEIWVGSK